LIINYIYKIYYIYFINSYLL